MTGPSTALSPTLGGVWRSGRAVLLVAALVVLAAAVPVLLAGPSSSLDYLDPRDTTLRGGAGLAALVRERGVQVTRLEPTDEALESLDARSMVLVSRPDTLTAGQAERLADSRAALLVVGTAHAAAFAPDADVRAGASSGSLRPDCDLPAATRAGEVYLGGATLAPGEGATGCYPVDGRPTLVRRAGVTVVGSGEFMTNCRLDEQGNAALAMNLAGARPRLVWLVAPTGGADASGSGGLLALVPPQVPWAVATLVLALLSTALWRGRRLGPVVAERLPVVVRASETVEGRGRLYRAHRARGQAAQALRSAATARLAGLLGLAGAAPPGQVAAAAATRIGQDAGEVDRLLGGPAPSDDGALVRLADDLDVLERRVRER